MDRIINNPVSEKIQITEINWERIFLEITVVAESLKSPVFTLRRFDRKRHKEESKIYTANTLTDTFVLEEVPIHPERIEGNKYYFTFNITAINGKTFLDNGKWQMVVSTEGETYVASVSYELAYQLDQKSQIYRYGNGKYSYDVSFSTFSENGTVLALVMNTHFMIENKSWKRRRYVQEAITLQGKFNRLYMYFAITMMRLYYQIVEHLSPKNGKRILFMSETRPYLWGNLKYIDNRMRERGLDKEFKLSYSLRKAVGQHSNAFSWVKLITQIAKQDYIFVDDYVPIFGFLELNSRTKLIQVWHAGEGFKAVGYCRFGKTGTPFPVGSCHKQYDYVVTGSERLVHVYSEVFGLPEENFLPVGMARLDGFLDENKIDAFKKEFYGDNPTYKGKKIILFAPTYRGTGQKTAFYDYAQLDLEKIYEFCGNEYIWAFRMHPFVAEKPPIPKKYSDRIVDLARYENINDLYYVSDILITDYSSAYFEYALMDRPVVFYTYDREAYELTRGVHKSVKDTAPGKVCDTFADMMMALKNKDYDIEKTKQFREENFHNYDGKAADKIIDAILLNKTEDIK